MQDARRIAPAATRNLPAVLASLARHAPATGHALELASGSGQQIVEFATAHPGLEWQASDRDAGNLGSIRAWAGATARLAPPVVLDAAQPGWSADHSHKSLIIMVNLLHLISGPAAQIVLHEAAKALTAQGRLMIYGPFLRGGQTTSPGDASFHASLRAQDPQIGYKDLDWVSACLARSGLGVTVEPMPANNLMLIAFRN